MRKNTKKCSNDIKESEVQFKRARGRPKKAIKSNILFY